MKKSKKYISCFLVIIMLAITGCNTQNTGTQNMDEKDIKVDVPVIEAEASDIRTEFETPKYIFLFIGDGMSFPQATALGFFNGTITNAFVGTLDEPTPDNMPKAELPSFTQFPIVGAATTYDASKFITDSASAATAIASGVKTLDGCIGVDAYGETHPTIAELLKKEKGYKIGIVSSVSIDHATPAGFYAHVASRKSYYDIGLQLTESDFDFFGGGGFKEQKGKEGDKEDILDIAAKNGYLIANTYEDIKALNTESGKAIAINPLLDNEDDMALSFSIDREEGDFGLADYVKKAIEVLDDGSPFFLMSEGGKVDWACHANDAYTAIQEVRDLDGAIKVALEFAEQHPDETLIIVTGDHETGGFGLGYGATGYDTYLSLLTHQTISYKKFELDYVVNYRENKVPFEEAMKDVQTLYGLVMPDKAEEATDERLILTNREIELLKGGYAESMIPYDDRILDVDYKAQYTMYEEEPFQIIITHILNNKVGIGWTTTAHSGLPTAVYAKGAGQEIFDDFYDNTDIFLKLKELTGLQ